MRTAAVASWSSGVAPPGGQHHDEGGDCHKAQPHESLLYHFHCPDLPAVRAS